MDTQAIKELFLNEDFKKELKNYIVKNLIFETNDREYSDGEWYRELIVKFDNCEIFCENVSS